MTNSSQWLNFY